MKTFLYPWFKNQWSKLSAISKKSFPHALLVTGDSGIGKYDFCRLLIQYLLCHKPINSLPCDECSACVQFKAGSHGDFWTLDIPEEKKSIGVGQIREMIEWVNLTHQSRQKKVLFIPDAKTMTLQAANALLKTLEEPPEDVVIILLVDHLKSLIATVRSRCQIISLIKPNKETLSQWYHELKSDWKVTTDNPLEKNQELLLSLAFSSPLKVKQLITTDAFKIRKKIIEQLFSIVDKKNKAPVLVAAELTKIELQEIIYWLQSILFDLIYIHYKIDDMKLINQDYHQQLSTISSETNTLLLFELLNELNQYYLFQGTSLNLPLLLDTYLIKWRNCKNVL